MTHFWIAVLALALPQEGGAAPGQAQEPSEPAAAVSSEQHGEEHSSGALDLRARVRGVMRRSAGAGLSELDEGTVREMVAVYEMLQRDRELSTGQRARLRTALRSRLARIEEVFSRRLAREEAAAERRTRRAEAEARRAGVEAPREEAAVHPQFGQLGQGAGVGAGGVAGGGGGFGPGTGGDLGWQLVELIRNTIAPDSWDVNGGAGTIYYYRPLGVLVIRNTQQVHEQNGGALGALRR